MYPNKAYCDRCAYSTEMHREYAENTMLSHSHSSDDHLGQTFLIRQRWHSFRGLNVTSRLYFKSKYHKNDLCTPLTVTKQHP